MRHSHFNGYNSQQRTNQDQTRRRARLARAVAGARPQAAWIEAFEPRLLLSASVTYRPQKPDGSLDTPITFQTQSGVQDFTPSQISLLQKGFAAPTYDLFLNATGITGDSTDNAHPNEINILSFNWGADAVGGTSSTGGAGTGKTQLQEIHLTSHVSKATPLLLAKLSSGEHIQNADLTVRKRSGNQPEFLTINLDNATIGSYQVTTALDGTFIEEYTLNFQHAEMAYRPQKPDGSLATPIIVAENGSAIIPFVPQQHSILQDGFHALNNQSLFLDLDTIPGESTNTDHQDAIEIKAFSWGGDALGGGSIGGGGGEGKTVLEEVHFVAQVSKASPKLLSALATGIHIPNAHFAAVKNGSNPFTFLNLDLQGVQVSSYQLSTGANGKILEEFTLNFTSADLDYTPQKNDGSADSPIHYSEHNLEVSGFAPTQVSLLDTGNTNTAANAFLHIDGVAGESAGDQNPGDIDVLSFSWGGDAIAVLGGGGAGTGKSTLQDLHVVSRFSKASPILLARMNSGQHIAAADLVVRSANNAHPEFFRIDLADAIISSYRVTTAQDGTLLEEFTLSYAQSGLTYKTLANDGSPTSTTSFTEHDLGVNAFTAPQPSLLDAPHATTTAASLGLFLTLDGIPGDSTANGHQNQIDILSFGWGGHDTQTISGGSGAGVGKSSVQELHFIAPVSQASPKLFAALASGQHIATAHFGAVHFPQPMSEFLTADLQGVTVSSDQIIVGKDGKLVEEFTLTFNTIGLDYKPQKNDGSLDTPVHLGINQPSFESYAPTQRALLDTGFIGPSAASAFLNIPNVPGESTNTAHPNEVEVLSFSWGGDATAVLGGGGGAGTGKTNLQQLHIVSRFSKASPLLLARMNSGQHIATADLALSRPNKTQGDFFTINLKDVIVTSYKVTTARDGTLLEEFTLAFGQAGETYKPEVAGGALGSPITFSEHGLGNDAFAPHQDQILQTGFVKPTTTDLFLNINGIDGESTADSHPDEIDLLAFSWGGNASGTGTTGGGSGAGKTTFQEVHFVSRISKASPSLLSRVLSGQHVPDATFTVQRKPNNQDFLKIRLQTVTITSYQITTALDGTAIEEFTLSFDATPSPTGPNADAGGPYNVNDNGTVTLDASASTDPDPASLTYAWDLDGDGIFGETGAAATRGDEVGVNPVFNAAGLFGPDVFQVTVRITDGAGLSDTASSSVRIVDVTPPNTIILTGPATPTNQTTATFTFTGTDQGTPPDQLTFTAKLDNGTPFDVTSPLTFSNLADGVHTLSLVATDQAGNSDPTPATFTWKVDTVGPNVITPAASPSPVSVGVPITLTATISDALTGASNIASAQYSLDNGMTWFNMTATDGAFNSPTEAVRATIAPLPAGIYTILFRGSDAAGNTGPISSITLPVFDRDAGKVTGDGNFDSPAGADPLHPTRTGNAQIQIDAQYKKNANTPTGNVSFKFGDINFQSTSLDYLIITSGNSARLAGSGQINGQGNYSFEISLIDGHPGQGAGGDLFRIRIINKATNQVIYDNGPTTPISAPPMTFLKGGNLKIHD